MSRRHSSLPSVQVVALVAYFIIMPGIAVAAWVYGRLDAASSVGSRIARSQTLQGKRLCQPAGSACYWRLSFQCLARHSATEVANAALASMYWLCFLQV